MRCGMPSEKWSAIAVRFVCCSATAEGVGGETVSGSVIELPICTTRRPRELPIRAAVLAAPMSVSGAKIGLFDTGSLAIEGTPAVPVDGYLIVGRGRDASAVRSRASAAESDQDGSLCET